MTDVSADIPYVDLKAQWRRDRPYLLPILEECFSSGHYIGSGVIETFENRVATLCGVKYCVALNSGTDALTLGLHMLGVGKGDEVITTPNSFIASTSVIAHLGARPVFVDVLSDQNMDPEKLNAAITSKTRAIMPVHLTGRVCRMHTINEIAREKGVPVIEDAAQAIGSKFRGKPSGSFGDVGCFSAHPLKNLSAMGDGGYLTTNSEEYYERARRLRNHGMTDRNTVNEFGFVSRMDSIQAAVLNYFNGLKNCDLLLPLESSDEFNSYHTFVIQTAQREDLRKHLEKKGIGTAIHYPVPIHLQPAAKKLGYSRGDFPLTEEQSSRILTLPIRETLNDEEMDRIVFEINSFYN